MPMKLCEHCGIVPLRWSKRRFCSRRCWMEHVAKTCERCGQKRPLGTLRFCSQACYFSALRGGPVERFWAKVEKSDGCWDWKSSIKPTGYGTTRVDGKTKSTHRIAYELAIGPIPDGLCVLHRCDNRRCCRPDHLFLGTKGDNNRDASAKGRTALGDRNSSRARPERHPRGTRHGMHKLTDDEVHAIRRNSAAGDTRTDLARRFHVTARAIDFVVSRHHWKHVT